jgi:hypothetical protein
MRSEECVHDQLGRGRWWRWSRGRGGQGARHGAPRGRPGPAAASPARRAPLRDPWLAVGCALPVSAADITDARAPSTRACTSHVSPGRAVAWGHACRRGTYMAASSSACPATMLATLCGFSLRPIRTSPCIPIPTHAPTHVPTHPPRAAQHVTDEASTHRGGYRCMKGRRWCGAMRRS